MASTSPDSLFTQRKICAMPTPQGRIFLVDRKLKILDAGKTQEYEAKNSREYLDLLDKYFGIKIEAEFRKAKLGLLETALNQVCSSRSSASTSAG